MMIFVIKTLSNTSQVGFKRLLLIALRYNLLEEGDKQKKKTTHGAPKMQVKYMTRSEKTIKNIEELT